MRSLRPEPPPMHRLSWLRRTICVAAAVLFAEPAASQVAQPTPEPAQEQVTAQPAGSTLPSALTGKIIRNINVNVREIFDEDQLGSFYRAVNAIKIQTREELVRRELLFKQGDTYDDFLVKESERNLRNQRFLRNIKIKPVAQGQFVDIDVSVQDTWTLIPQVNYSTGTGKNRKSIGLAESNLLGYGKRFEFLYDEDESRESVDLVWDDPRVWGTYNRLIAAYFNRTDGDRYYFQAGRPFRSLVEKSAWMVKLDTSDSIGRLFEDSDESQIFRQDRSDIEIAYTIAKGEPEKERHRFSFGYGYLDEEFTQADSDDFEDLDLDPLEVEAPERITDDRRYTGPVLTFEHIEPEFISMNYIDRFDRVEDYNLGFDYSTNAFIAPDFLGADENRLLLSGVASRGRRLSRDSFWRGEAGFGTRIEEHGLDNTILSAEFKYFNALTPISIGNFHIGRHTLAAAASVDYAIDLDENKQFTLGGDNGVRGYKARTFTGDKRLVLNLEDRMHFVDDIFKLMSFGAAVFVDAGASTYDSFGRMLTDEMYADVGAGLRFAFPRSSGGRVFRIDVALPLRDGADGSSAFEPRIIFAGGQLFGARNRSETNASVQSTIAAGLGDN